MLSSSREWTLLFLQKHCFQEGKGHKEKQGGKGCKSELSKPEQPSIFGVPKLTHPGHLLEGVYLWGRGWGQLEEVESESWTWKRPQQFGCEGQENGNSWKTLS